MRQNAYSFVLIHSSHEIYSHRLSDADYNFYFHDKRLLLFGASFWGPGLTGPQCFSHSIRGSSITGGKMKRCVFLVDIADGFKLAAAFKISAEEESRSQRGSPVLSVSPRELRSLQGLSRDL